MKILLPRLAMTSLLALVLYAAQATQTLAGTTGSINGRVTDEQGQPVAGVRVSVVSPSYTGTTTSQSNGFYDFNGLPPDTYTLTFSSPGYLTTTQNGITVSQDQVVVLNITLHREVKTLGRVSVHATTDLVQPHQTADQYVITGSNVTAVTGTPQDISETAVLNSLPGITTDSGGYPIIRGGLENDEGFELEGIDATEPITGQFINSLALNGVARLEVSTGGYSASEGNTNSGVVNVVAKRGTYPGEGEITARVGWPNFDHRLAFEYGSATPNNRFSYYYSFNGDRTASIYGDGKTWFPFLNDAVNFESGNDNVVNFFYHWGATNQNELQYYADFGSNLFNLGYQLEVSQLPYATNNGFVQLVGGLGTGLFADPAVSMIDFAPRFPTQVGLAQNINYPDHEDENHQIQKVNFKHQFNAQSFGEIRVFRTQSNVNFLYPWDGGAFGDFYEFDGSDNRGIAFDYSDQLSSTHELSFGGETIFTRPNFAIAIPSTTLFTDPLECGLPCLALGLTGEANPNVITYVSPLYQQVQGFFGAPSATQPLNQLPNNASHIFDDVHRSNAWIDDRWQPNDRLTVEPSIRWDQEILELPSNTAQANVFYATEGNCNPFLGSTASCLFFDEPGVQVGSNVTRPSFVAPRLAVAYETDSSNVFRFSYGRFMEFTPLSNIENTYDIPSVALGCTIANGCFTPLPGYSPTCVNGHDPANGGALCNGITNLYQQIVEDLNKNNFQQYTPVLPQLATSADLTWEHDFGRGLQLKITPYYRKGTNYVVSNTPLLFNLPNGTSVFGSPRESNAGINYNTGIEFALDRNVTYGLSGFIHLTYDNTLANYTSDFFPSTNAAALALNHFFHVSYVSPVVGQGNLSYNTRQGWHVYVNVPYISGYRYGVGTKTFVFLPLGPNGGLVPVQVLNTDLAQSAQGHNAFQSAYYFTDPTNPGTILHPNIVASRGTPEGPDPGSLFGPSQAFLNLTVAHDINVGHQTLQVGLRGVNLLGNYSINTPGDNYLFRPQGLGVYSSASGKQAPIVQQLEPYQPNLGPFAYENEPVGLARTYVVYVNAKF
jgi:hypothetical protein